MVRTRYYLVGTYRIGYNWQVSYQISIMVYRVYPILALVQVIDGIISGGLVIEELNRDLKNLTTSEKLNYDRIIPKARNVVTS